MPSTPTRTLALWALTLTGLPATAQTLLQPAPTSAPLLALTSAPVRAVAGDLDGDGDDDLVLPQGNALVRFVNTAGVFTGNPIAATNVAPELLALGDFDADGLMDLAAGSSGFPNASLRVWWGDGSGTFPTANPGGGPLAPEFLRGPMIATDVDGDGDLDFVLRGDTNFGPGGSLLVRNLGNRVLTAAPTAQFPAADSGLSEPFAVDVDGDGLPEIVWVSRNARTRLYWNNGGNFVEATTAQFPLLQRSLRGLASGDLDGDGDLDLVLGGHTETGVLLRTVGPRQLALDPVPATDLRTLFLTAVDADGDGDLDLQVLRGDHDELRRNDGAGTFALAEQGGYADEADLIVPLDLDDDGDTDYLRLGDYTQGSSVFATVGADYTVVPGHLAHAAGRALPVSANLFNPPAEGDVDGDGDVDFTFDRGETHGSVPGSTMQVANNDGQGHFTYAWQPRAIANAGFFADLDGDGLVEFVRTAYAGGASYLANLDGVLANTLLPLPAPTFAPIATGIGGDFDGDGDPDLVLIQTLGTYKRVLLLDNLGGGTFADVSATRVSGNPANGDYPHVATADFDGDGDLDLLLVTANQSQVWRNDGGVLTFAPGAIPINAYGSVSYGWSVADFDGDGDLDITIGKRLLVNQGNGTFVVWAQQFPNVSYVEGVRFALDVDDDGDVDLLSGGPGVYNNGFGSFSLIANLMPPIGNGDGLLQAGDYDRDGDADAIVRQNGIVTVMLNQLRQLRVEEPAPLGGNLRYHIVTRPGEVAIAPFVWLAVSFATIAPLPVPDFGWLQIDPQQATLLGPFLMPATGGELVHDLAVPATPALRGLEVAAQTLELRGSRLRLGNLATTRLGR